MSVCAQNPRLLVCLNLIALTLRRGARQGPLQAVSNPSDDAETQRPLASAVLAGNLRRRLVESTGGNTSRLPKLSFGRTTSQGGSNQSAVKGWAGQTAAAAMTQGVLSGEQHLRLSSCFCSVCFLWRLAVF